MHLINDKSDSSAYCMQSMDDVRFGYDSSLDVRFSLSRCVCVCIMGERARFFILAFGANVRCQLLFFFLLAKLPTIALTLEFD